jgi:prepilin-type N-terminal cleavage/methylation domain-containing protein
MITASGAGDAQTRKRSVQGAVQQRRIRKRGFTLIEALVSLFLLGVVGVLIGAAFSFSVKSQQDTGLQLKAARNAGRVLEILRTADFDSLDPIESGWPLSPPFQPVA